VQVAIKVMRRRNKPGRVVDPEKELRRGKDEIGTVANCQSHTSPRPRPTTSLTLLAAQR
jgi:hypothetical protein